MKEEECRLVNRPTKRIDFRSDDFISINQRLDSFVILSFVFNCLIFMLLLRLTNRLYHSFPPRMTLNQWSLYEIAFGRKSLPLISKASLFSISFSWFAFFSITLVTATFQTGLIQSISFLHIDTLQDIIDHSCTPTALAILYCRRSVQGSKIPLYQKIADQLDVISAEESTPLKMLELVNNSSKVLIENQSFGTRLKGMTCMLDGPEEKNASPIYISKKSVARFIHLIVLSSATKPETARAALKRASFAFETANFDNHALQLLDFKSVGVRNLYGQCIQSKTNDNEIIITPLSMRYFTRTLIIFGKGSVVASAILLIELMFKRIKSIGWTFQKFQVTFS